jgi:hypothetical protein
LDHNQVDQGDRGEDIDDDVDEDRCVALQDPSLHLFCVLMDMVMETTAVEMAVAAERQGSAP